MASNLRNIKFKGLIKLKPNFWKKLAVQIRGWIKEDMTKGNAQKVTGRSSYSSQYARYKANDMRRFTDGKRIGSAKTTSKGTVTPKYNRLQGKQLSNHTGSVNMMLTGTLINGLKYISSTFYDMIMSYDVRDSGKVKGNELLGRYVRTLNEKNHKKTKDEIVTQLNKQLKDGLPKQVVIDLTIGI